MKKLIAVALLAVPFTFAQAPATSNAPATEKTDKVAKKHAKKHTKKHAKAEAGTPATTPAPAAKTK